MAFKLKSGNKPPFKQMGSSPNSMRMTQDPRVNMGDRGMMTGNMKDKTMSTNYKDPAKLVKKEGVDKDKRKNVDKKAVDTTKVLSMNTKDPYAEALKKDSNLPEYIKKRKTLEKGSAEYNANQNRINKAYGEGPMRDVESTTKSNDRKTVVTESIPAVSDTRIKVKNDKVKKTEVDHIKGTVTKGKQKAGEDKKLGTEDDVVKKKTRKKFSESKVGKSKVGQLFVSKKNKKGGMNSTTVNATEKKKKEDNKGSNSSNPMA